VVVMQRRIFVGVVLLGAVGCDRWRPNTPHTLFFREPLAAFDSSVATLQQSGYPITQADRDRYHIQVASKLEGSFISLQIYADARMILRVHGEHVRGDKVHKKLDQEVGSVMAALRASGQVVR
jgi:hypothetical protein